MKYGYKFRIFLTAVLLSLSGCTPSVPVPPENVEVFSSESSTASIPAQSESIASEPAPEPPEKPKPRTWDIDLQEGYEPDFPESSLYQEIKPSEDIPYKKIYFKAFGEGKIIFEYCTEKHMFNSGDSYSKGNVVVYDIETQTYNTAGDHFQIGTPFSGHGIVMDSGYYCTDYIFEDEQSLPCMEKVNLATGEKTIPVMFDDGNNYGRAFKVDDTHFLIYFDVFISEGLWENALYLYDTETDKAVPLPKEISKCFNLSVWEGKLYGVEIPPDYRFSTSPKDYGITVYDLQSGEIAVSKLTTGEICYVLPGEPLDSYVGEGQIMTAHFPIEPNLDDKNNAYYIVWENNVPVRLLLLSLGGREEHLTQLAQNTGTAYFWKDHVLFLMDIKTGQLRMMDMGYREKYPYMRICTDTEGNLLLVNSSGNKVPDVYFIPRSTVNRLSVPAVNTDGLVQAQSSPSESVDHSERRTWDLVVPGGYEPYAEESSGLYQEIHIPHDGDIENFGKGKIIFSYTTNEEENSLPDGGYIGVYDLETGNTVTAGDKYPMSTPYAGDKIIMKSGYYYTENSLGWSNDSAPRMERVDLETAKRTYHVLLDAEFWGGLNYKLDDSHFFIYFKDNKPGYIFDVDTETGYYLPNPFPKSHWIEDVFVQEGKIYWITSTAQPDSHFVISYDPQTGKATEPEPITEELYSMPWEPVSPYLEKGEKVIFYPYGWLVWEKDGSLRQIDLEHPDIDCYGRKIQLGQTTGTAYILDESNHLLFLVNIHTGEARVLDAGYRKKYRYMSFQIDEEGNVLLLAKPSFDAKEKKIYFIPQSTIEKFAVPANEYIYREGVTYSKSLKEYLEHLE